MAKLKKGAVDRRNFLKSAVAGAAVLAGNPGTVAAQQAELRRNDPPPISPQAERGSPSNVEVLTADRTGSDFMVDVIKSLGFEYVCANPAATFRGLQESIINYGGNKSPEFLTCCHEESAVGIAHGYAKVEGKPLLILAHGTVGLQHASMAIYNAYCDRVPVYVILGNVIDETKRVPGVEWVHSAQDAAALVRDFTKWDDLPISLEHFAESTVRAYKIAMTPPTLPVVIVADGELQESPIPVDTKFHIPKLVRAVPPVAIRGRSPKRRGCWLRLRIRSSSPIVRHARRLALCI